MQNFRVGSMSLHTTLKSTKKNTLNPHVNASMVSGDPNTFRNHVLVFYYFFFNYLGVVVYLFVPSM